MKQSSRIKINPVFWSHDLSIPIGTDISPASIFQKHKYYLVFDLETKTLVDAVGGWKNFNQLEVSIACAYDSKTDKILVFREEELPKLIKLCKERLVVGYNSSKFDLPILAKYGLDTRVIDSFDLMLEIQNASSWKYVKLEKVANATLGTGKSAEGTMAVKWWEEGKVEKIIEYCKRDVEITRDVFQYGIKNGFIKISKTKGPAVEFPVDWT